MRTKLMMNSRKTDSVAAGAGRESVNGWGPRPASALMLAALLTAAAWGQVGGPTPGYVFDSAARELRPMRGMAGAAHLGAALLKDTDAASVSSDGTMAAAARFGMIEVVRGFDSAASARVALAQEPGEVLFAWAGHDLAAVFTESRKVMIWRGVDASSDNVVTLDISNLDGVIQSALLDGEDLLLAAKGGLYLTKRGETRRIAMLEDPSAMLVAGRDLFVADRKAGHVLQVREFAGAAVTEKFAGVGRPVGLQMARRGLLVASAETRTVDAFDVVTKERLGSVELDFVPTRMEALGARPLALLNNGSAAEPLYVLDSSDSPQVYFVPAGREQ